MPCALLHPDALSPFPQETLRKTFHDQNSSSPSLFMHFNAKPYLVPRGPFDLHALITHAKQLASPMPPLRPPHAECIILWTPCTALASPCASINIPQLYILRKGCEVPFQPILFISGAECYNAIRMHAHQLRRPGQGPSL